MALLLGVLAGAFTTVVGMGGGVMLLLALSAWWDDPLRALATTAPALLLGNLHRLLMYRGQLAWPVAVPFIAGALPGALVGGLLAVSVPAWIVQAAMLAAAFAATGRSLGWWDPHPAARSLVPAGAGIGVVSATVGGAGFIAGPFLLATGLTGGAYLATMSASSLAMHLGRLVAYGVGGLVDGELMVLALGMAVAIAIGNTFGGWARSRVPTRWTARLELVGAVAMVALALVGLLR